MSNEKMNISNKISIVYDDEEVLIEVKPTDYIGKKYLIQDGSLIMETYPRVPKNGLSTVFKGDIGEELGKIICNLTREQVEDLYILTPKDCTYDLESRLSPIKIDIKTGYESYEEKGATNFSIYLDTNKPGKNAMQVSATKYKKNYEAEGIDFLLCICIFNDPCIVPSVYLIPTNSIEVRENVKIVFPASGRTKYHKYKLDLSEVMRARELMEEDTND